MAFVKEYYTKKKETHIRKRKCFLFSCDQCGKEYSKFDKKYCKREFTFCSRDCFYKSLKKGGVSDEKLKKTHRKMCGEDYPFKTQSFKEERKKTCLKKYGEEHIFKTENFKEKRKQTCIKKYGVEYVSQNTQVKEKMKKTCQKKYGVDHISQSQTIKDKIKKTNIERYGVEHSSQSKQSKEKMKKTNIERYGVHCTFQSQKIKEKIKNTNIERYGFKVPTQNIKIFQKVRETNLKRYGCEIPTQNPAIYKKAHETKKKNGSYRKSKSEDKFYEYLCLKYGNLFIERQARINNWSIDFYIRSKNIYIQFDGNYWHGINKSLAEIKSLPGPQFSGIYQTMLRDIEQNKWFKKNNKTLIRIKESDFKRNYFFLNEEHSFVYNEFEHNQ